MNITWHGQSCFQIEARPNKGEQVSIIIDPYSEEIGLRVPKLKGDILLVTHSHSDHNNIKAVSAPASERSPFLINGPGEYEIKKVFIKGINSWHDDKEGKERGQNTIYTIEAEDLHFCHLGDLGQKELTEDQLEEIGDVDILMIPVGGVYTISAKEALRIMSQIEPKIIIPMHYHLPKLKIKLDGLDSFLKSLGIKSIEPQNKLTVKKDDLSLEEAKIMVLNSN